MAINVNTVYTTVLSILNKEQRGYLTPDEFNKLATQVQLETFEKFFEDYNQFLRMPKTDVEYASRMDHTYEEFQTFDETAKASSHVVNTDSSVTYLEPIKDASLNSSPVHRMGSVVYSKANGSPQIELMGKKQYYLQTKSPLLQPSLNFPIGVYAANKITVYPSLNSTPSNDDVEFNYIRKPLDARWGFTIGSLGQYIYDSNLYVPSGLAVASLTSSTNLIGSAAGAVAPATSISYPLTQGAAGTGNLTFQTNGSGTGAEINFTVNGTGAVTLTNTNTFINVTLSGKNYAVGDTITIATNSFLTGSPSINIIITLTEANLMSGTGQGSIQFEISESQQTETILGVLKYAGLIIKDTQIIQAASGLQQIEETNSKK